MSTLGIAPLEGATELEAAAARTGNLLGSLLRRPLAVLTGGYLLVLIVCAISAGWIAPDTASQIDLSQVLHGPTGPHLLGTDQLGRDVLSRLLYGARPALLDVAVAVAAFLAFGVPLGLIAGYLGGWTDRIIMWWANLLFALPGIVVLLMVVAVFPGNDLAAMLTVGIGSTQVLIRIVRGSTMAIRNELYVRAAALSGLRTTAILRRHVLPRLAGPIIVQTSLFAASALIAESGLSFLGLLRPEAAGPSWGNMVADASQYMSEDAWLLVPSGGALLLTVVAFSVFGDAVRDATASKALPASPFERHRRGGPRQAPAGPNPQADGALLAVDGVSVDLRASGDNLTSPILRSVSFTVTMGEAVGIVGESGCGKSMAAKAILGLLPGGARITAGSILFEGKQLSTMDERALGRVRGTGIGLISQDAVGSLDPSFTVGSQLREVIRRHHSVSRDAADKRAAELLGLVQINNAAEILKFYPHQLSGGMAQRVVIALALAAEPRLLIADEPTTALDVTTQAEVLALLRQLQRDLGMALILITHDWGVLADICDRAIVMYAGEVVEEGPLDEIYKTPAHPYSAALVACNPHVAAVGERLPTIPGTVPDPRRRPRGCQFAERCTLAGEDCRAGAIPILAVDAHHTSRCIHIEELAAEVVR